MSTQYWALLSTLAQMLVPQVELPPLVPPYKSTVYTQVLKT